MSPSTPSAPEHFSPRPSIDSLDSEAGIHEVDSSSALILVPEHHDEIDGEDPAAFDFVNSSDEDESPNGESQDNLFERGSSGSYSSVSSLSSLSVFLYLLSPLLKLGALLSPATGAQGLKLSLPALFLFAGLCALTRQVWYMLARYLRRADMEEIVLQALARGAGRGRDGERKRRWIRRVVHLCTGTLRVLLIASFLRASSDTLALLLPPGLLSSVSSRVAIALLLTAIVLPLSISPATSLSTPTVLWASWISVFAFVAWVAGTAYAHAHGISLVSQKDSQGSLGSLWDGLSIIAFTFSTSSTLHLYSSLRTSTTGVGTSVPKRSRSFKLLSLGSIVLATALILPPTVFSSMAASPFHAALSQDESTPSESRTPFAFKCLMGFLSATALTLGVPSVLVTAPVIPVPLSLRRYVNHLLVSRLATLALSLGIALLPTSLAKLASNVLIVLAFSGTFIVPALLHIIIHHFRRPLSIIMPPSTPHPGASPSFRRSEAHDDELLQRKERALQRRRFTRHVFWDVGVWMPLLPVGAGGIVWAGGRLAGRW